MCFLVWRDMPILTLLIAYLLLSVLGNTSTSYVFFSMAGRAGLTALKFRMLLSGALLHRGTHCTLSQGLGIWLIFL